MKRLLSSLIITLFISVSVFAQTDKPSRTDWHHLDLLNDNFFGISSNKAYAELLSSKTPLRKIIVAVIDGGTDIEHEDLKSVIWKNEKEIPGNGIDDDGNGYIDDVYGWNFLGSSTGDIQFDNLEVTRLVRKYQPKFINTSNITPMDSMTRIEYNEYRRYVSSFSDKRNRAELIVNYLTPVMNVANVIKEKVGDKRPITGNDISKYKANTDVTRNAKKVLSDEFKKAESFDKMYEELAEVIEYYSNQLNYHLNVRYNPRDMVGDNYEDAYEIGYGNANVAGPDPEHGTHVAGIIGADRTNDIGIKGIADFVQIMPIRAVPDGDEHDKDVANAIRYAVDNGANIINMSFGKEFSWDKVVVDSAVKYAMSKGVLMVHSAGNDGKNVDVSTFYPNPYYSNGTDTARLWLTVGASSWTNDDKILAGFSNYGAKSVDVFAPGVQIYSTMPSSKYKNQDGTSMAGPVVSGVAAVLMSYFPNLTTEQVKEIIIKSVTKVDNRVRIRNEKGEQIRVPFSQLSVSGGVVNLYNAVKMAQEYTLDVKND